MDLLGQVEHDTSERFRKNSVNKGGEYVGPCPFCRAGDDRFHVWPDHPASKPRYWCRICGQSGDVIQYFRDLHGMGYREACQAAGVDPGDRPTRPPARRRATKTEPPPSKWQVPARAFVQYAQDQLWSEAGYPAREYLHCERGLTDDTIRHFGLGYNPMRHYDDAGRWGLSGNKIYVSPGIVIPCEIKDVLWYIQIRRPYDPGEDKTDVLLAYLGDLPAWCPEAKYMAVRGGQGRALFGTDDLRGTGQPLLLCEGEFDAMLAWQELGDVVDVCTLGGAQKTSRGLPTRWLLRFLPYKVICVAYDVDANQAGDKGAAKFLKQSRRAVRVRVPRGGDLTGFWQQGGDLQAWAAQFLPRDSHFDGGVQCTSQ